MSYGADNIKSSIIKSNCTSSFVDCKFFIFFSEEMFEGTMGEEGEDLEREDLDSSPASHQLATALGMNAHRIQVMKASFFADQSQLSPYLPRDAPTVDKALLSGSFGKAGHSKSAIYPAVKPLGPLLSPKVTRCVDESGQLSQSLFGSPKIGNLLSFPSLLV